MPNRKLEQVVKNRQLVSVSSNTSVKRSCEIMREMEVSSILIIDEGKLRGIFTERDLLNKVVCEDLNPIDTKIGDVMTVNVVGLESDKPLIHALHLMYQNSFRHVPVLKNGNPIGIVSARDALGIELEQFEKELKIADELFEII